MQNGSPYAPGPMEEQPRRRRRYRSLFWPVVLIAAGVIWLLANLDVISTSDLALLGILWPILIVGIGVDLLVGRRSPALGGIVGVVTVGIIIVLVFVGPSLGWTGESDLKTETFITPVGQAAGARVELDLSEYSAQVFALPASTLPDRPLLDAEITYRGSVDFESTGDVEKTISIKTRGRHWWWSWPDDEEVKPWRIGLDPSVPLSLNVGTSSGSVDLDLSNLSLSRLELDTSSGKVQVALPGPGAQTCVVDLQLSSGDVEIRAPSGARLDMEVDMSSGDTLVAVSGDSDVDLTFQGSSGAFTLELPSSEALRVEVRNISSGDVNLPAGLVQIAGDDGEEGIWETQGYAEASHKVLLLIEDMSSGDVEIVYGD